MRKTVVTIVLVLLALLMISWPFFKEDELRRYKESHRFQFIMNYQSLSGSFNSVSRALTLYQHDFTEQEWLLFKKDLQYEGNQISRLGESIRILFMVHSENEDELDSFIKAFHDSGSVLRAITMEEVTDESTIHEIGRIYKRYARRVYSTFGRHPPEVSPELQEQLHRVFQDMNEEIDALLDQTG